MMEKSFDANATVAVDPGYALLLTAIDRLRTEMTTRPSAMANYGLSVVVQFELRLAEVIPPGLPAEAASATYAEIARRFLDAVLPDENALRQTDVNTLTLYRDALADPRHDPGLFAAAFGSARPGLFDHDKRLRYRVGGYRGRPGDPLADYFIQNVIEPAIANAGRVCS
jgi:hypothetical protein